MTKGQRLQYERFRMLHEIEPSRGFVTRTMQRIKNVERRRKILLDLWIVVLSLGPYLVQQSWLLFRRDYFSVKALPFSHLISETYLFVISSSIANFMLIAGVLAAAAYLYLSRSALMFRFFERHQRLS